MIIVLCQGKAPVFIPDSKEAKFDRIEYEDENTRYELSGVVLNLNSASDSILSAGDEHLQKTLKGAWIYSRYDKKSKQLFISNDLLSKEYVYYYSSGDLIVVSNSFYDLCDELKKQGKQPKINFPAVKELCETCSLTGNKTYESNTFFLRGYESLHIDCSSMQLSVVQLTPPEVRDASEVSISETVDKLDALFKEACLLQWRKNEEWGKDQVLTVSGGMDTRAVIFYQKENIEAMPDRIKAFSYGQSHCDDNTIADKLAKKINADYSFIPIDECGFVFMKDECVAANEGQFDYAGSTGAIELAKKCAASCNPGILHTGLGGGEIMGDIIVADGDCGKNDRGFTVNQDLNLENMRRCLNFQKLTRNYFTAMSPFLYEDFFELLLSLPASIKMKRKLYLKWYNKYMNLDMQTTSYDISNGKLASYFIRAYGKVTRTLGMKTKYDMTPLGYWYISNKKIRRFFKDEWEKDKKELPDYPGLVEYLDTQFNIMQFTPKTNVLSVSAALIRMK